MAMAFSVYFSESLKIIIIAIKNPQRLTSLLVSWHCMAFVMCSFHVAEIIHLALLCLADTSMYCATLLNQLSHLSGL